MAEPLVSNWRDARPANAEYLLRLMGCLAILVSSSCSSGTATIADTDPTCERAWRWTEHAGNPLFAIPDQPTDPFYGWIWNDPSVVKIDGTYHMYLSGGSAFASPIEVHIYRATSTDRLSWTIDETPVLSPSTNASDWDSLRVETPSVIIVGDTFHMYFSGCDGSVWGCGEPGTNPYWVMGHATSSDGLVWTKDPANPILLQPDASKWGYPGAGEPGAFYSQATSTIHVYGVGGKVIDSFVRAGVLLATATNGSDFTWHSDGNGEPIPLMSDSPGYPYNEGWLGHSTPMVFRDRDGVIHLFYDAMGPGYRQQAIAHAVSDDGSTFTESEVDITTAPDVAADGNPDHGAWNDHETWGETVLQEDDGSLSMWFVGKKVVPDNTNPGSYLYYNQGIGFASATPYCR